MIKTLTDSDYDDIIKKNRISVVKVFAPWCGPCKFMKSHYEKWSEQLSIFNGNDVRFYEMDHDKNRQFVEKYKIESMPTFVFFVYGVEVFKIKGITRISIFEDILRKSLEIKYEIKEESA